MTNPLQLLSNEHRTIEQVLDCLEVLRQRARFQHRLDGGPARDAVSFLRAFADECHHAKEEHQLFPMMESHGFDAASGPTRVMRAEHEQGRALLAAMEGSIPEAELGDAEGLRSWMAAAGQYVALLRAHIRKEDECLFPLANEALDTRELSELAARFERIEKDEIGPGVHEDWLALADRLADRLDVRRDRLPESAPRCGCRSVEPTPHV